MGIMARYFSDYDGNGWAYPVKGGHQGEGASFRAEAGSDTLLGDSFLCLLVNFSTAKACFF